MKEPRIPHPTLPGEMLMEEFLVPLRLSQSELARRIGTSPRAINEIGNGKRAISPIMAMNFASQFENICHAQAEGRLGICLKSWRSPTLVLLAGDHNVS